MAALNPDVPVFSNDPDVVYIRLGRVADSIPWNQDNPDHETELAAMKDALARGDGVVVSFDANRRPYLPNLDALVAHGDPIVQQRFDDGAVVSVR